MYVIFDAVDERRQPARKAYKIAGLVQAEAQSRAL